MDQGTIERLHAIRDHKYTYVVCITLWLYEYCSTFILEVQLIWSARWASAKCLFLLIRYFQFCLVGVLVHQIGISGPVLSVKDCIRTGTVIDAMACISLCLAETMFTVRTWAVLGRTRRSGVFLAVFVFALWVPALSLTGYGLVLGARLPPSPSGPVQVLIGGCMTVVKSKVLDSMHFVFLVLFYLVTTSLMAIKGFEHFVNRTSYNHFIGLVYLDGILYYIYLLVLSITNLVIVYIAPPGYGDILVIPQGFVASILACKMMLNLRAYDQVRFKTVHISSIHFDVGQTLDQGESEGDGE